MHGRRSSSRFLLAALAACALPASGSAQQCPQTWHADRGVMFDHTNAPLTEISDIVVDRRGRVAVGDEKTNTIYLFWNGRLSGSLGRRGDGPGEFNHPDNMMVLKDSLYVADTGHQRVTVFAPDGRVARTIRFTESYAPYMMGEVYPLGNRFMMIPSASAALVLNREGFRLPVLVLSADGAVVDTLGTPLLRKNGMGMLSLPGGGQAFFRLPSPEVDFVDVDPAGTGVVFATGSVRDKARTITITKVSPSGGVVFARTLNLAAEPAPKAYLDSAFQKLVESYGSRFSSTQQARRAIEDAWWVSDEPWPVQGLIVDNDSRIWVRTGLQRNKWMVLSETGVPTACIEFPRSTELYAVQGKDAWGLYTDGDGVQSVVRYGIR